MSKLIFRFNNQNLPASTSSKDILGGKGTNLAQMAKLGLPVPPGFTISTEVCEYFYKNNKKITKQVIKQTQKELKIIEKITKKNFGDVFNPLLISVRSGSRVSMPGMMDTILNLGLNDKTVVGLKKKTQNGRFAKDSYRRFIQMYSDIVLGVPHEDFEELLEAEKLSNSLILDTELKTENMKSFVVQYHYYT